MPAQGRAKTIAEPANAARVSLVEPQGGPGPHADTDGRAHARNATTSNPRKESAMPIIDVTALAGTEVRISSVERRSVLQLHSASSPTRTARRAHLFWISLTRSTSAFEPNSGW